MSDILQSAETQIYSSNYEKLENTILFNINIDYVFKLLKSKYIS
jgi:hypothetical protein